MSYWTFKEVHFLWKREGAGGWRGCMCRAGRGGAGVMMDG